MANKKYSLVARDFNSPLTRNYIFTKAFTRYPELLKIPKVILFTFSEKNSLYYFSDLKTWEAAHNHLKARILKNHGYFDGLVEKFLTLGERYSVWTKEKIFDADLRSKSNSTLMKLYHEFIDKQSELYAYGVCLPILDFQEFAFVEINLNKILKAKVKDSEFSDYFSVFTYPHNFSFAQEQEIHLLKLMRKYYNADWVDFIKNNELEAIKKEYPAFFKDLTRHANLYAWVYYVYAGPSYAQDQYLLFIKDYLEKGIDSAKKIEEIVSDMNRMKKKKRECLRKLEVNKFEKYILEMAGKVVWAKPRRKDYQSRIYYYVEKLQKEFGRRLRMSLAQIRSLTPDMIEDALKTGKDYSHFANEAGKMHYCIATNKNRVKVYVGAEALKFKENNFLKETKREAKGEFQGQVAYAGKATGSVKIINTVEDMNKMQAGDILLSVATTPSIVPAMKKAAAILTDEGGLTCHASIVSRELKIPCIIGFKEITSHLKDGDRVTVDAVKGIVKKI